MLRELQINNIALIDMVDISFGPGFCALTGETGAGKSIIIDSINAVLGGRVSRELIKTGKESAKVEAVFDTNEKVIEKLNEYGIECDDDSLILYREIHAGGKNICRCNGRLITVGCLHEIAARLVDIHGQHDNQTLLDRERHIELLDMFGGNGMVELSAQYADTWRRHSEVRSALRNISKAESERARELDMLDFQLDEIAKAKLTSGEDVRLKQRRDTLRNIASIRAALSEAYICLAGDEEALTAVNAVSEAADRLSSVRDYGDQYEKLSDSLNGILYDLEDVISDIRRENDNAEEYPGELEEVEERLEVIGLLCKKYGPEIDDVLAFAENAEKRKNELLGSEKNYDELKVEEEALRGQLLDIAKRLTVMRHEAALRLEKGITDNLEDLEMKNVRFKVMFDESNRVLNEKGADIIEFLISPNKGEALKPLAKIASGGELARIMLAIKAVITDIDDVPTLIFDEIDSGLGGVAAQKTGMKLADLSAEHQVICVTHQAQIASFADTHFQIRKFENDDRTVTEVQLMEGDARVGEIARLLSGDEARDISEVHAAKLLESGSMYRRNRQR